MLTKDSGSSRKLSGKIKTKVVWQAGVRTFWWKIYPILSQKYEAKTPDGTKYNQLIPLLFLICFVSKTLLLLFSQIPRSDLRAQFRV